jgi:hypothetical protein
VERPSQQAKSPSPELPEVFFHRWLANNGRYEDGVGVWVGWATAKLRSDIMYTSLFTFNALAVEGIPHTFPTKAALLRTGNRYTYAVHLCICSILVMIM